DPRARRRGSQAGRAALARGAGGAQAQAGARRADQEEPRSRGFRGGMTMFALEVEYLTGRAVASKLDDRDAAEWPPHPGRIFMALVAAHLERDPEDAAERAALLWLEGLKPPEISAAEASHREVLDVFVPVNDNLGPDKVPKGGFSASVVADKIRVLPD